MLSKNKNLAKVLVLVVVLAILPSLFHSLPVPQPRSIDSPATATAQIDNSTAPTTSENSTKKEGNLPLKGVDDEIDKVGHSTTTKHQRKLKADDDSTASTSSSPGEEESNEGGNAEGDDGYEYETEEEAHATSTTETEKVATRLIQPETTEATKADENRESSEFGETSNISSDTTEGDASVSTGEQRHEYTNVKHVSKMLIKIIKTYNIRSMVDIPCRNSLDFMPELLHKIDFEVPGFKYYCVDTEKDDHEDILHLYSDAGNPEFIHLKPETASSLPKTDLIFLWDGPQDWGVTKFWAFLMHLRKIRPNYVLVTNNPGETNNEKAGILNLRKQPFHVSFNLCCIDSLFY